MASQTLSASETLKSQAQKLQKLCELVKNVDSMFDRIMNVDPVYKKIQEIIDEFKKLCPSPLSILDNLIDYHFMNDLDILPLLLDFQSNYYELTKEQRLEKVESIIQMYSNLGHVNENRLLVIKNLYSAIKNSDIQKIREKLSSIINDWLKLNYVGCTMYPFDLTSFTWYSISCLKCSKVMTSFSDFVERGPESQTHQWFCQKCLISFQTHITEIDQICSELGIKSEQYHKVALRKLDLFVITLNSVDKCDIDNIVKNSKNLKSYRSSIDPDKIWVMSS